MIAREKRNANIRLFILADLVRPFEVHERNREACSVGMNIYYVFRQFEISKLCLVEA